MEFEFDGGGGCRKGLLARYLIKITIFISCSSDHFVRDGELIGKWSGGIPFEIGGRQEIVVEHFDLYKQEGT